MSKKKTVEPIPEQFNSYEEAAGYPEAFRTVKVTAELKRRRYERQNHDD